MQIFFDATAKNIRQYLTYGGFFDRKQTGEDAPEMRCRINQRFLKGKVSGCSACGTAGRMRV